MTATYSADKNELQELACVNKPDTADYWWAFQYDEAMEVYEKHITSLRRIPCSPECKGLWIDQQRLVEGMDYEVRQVPCPYFDHIDDPVDYSTEAFPLVPVKSEDDIENITFKFDDVLEMLIDFGNSVLSAKSKGYRFDMPNDAAEWLSDQLKTKKQQSNGTETNF